MLGIAGILVALGLLILLSYRGVSILLLAPLMALIAVVFAGAPLLASYTQVFMPALGSFIVQFYPSDRSGRNQQSGKGCGRGGLTRLEGRQPSSLKRCPSTCTRCRFQ